MAHLFLLLLLLVVCVVWLCAGAGGPEFVLLVPCRLSPVRLSVHPSVRYHISFISLSALLALSPYMLRLARLTVTCTTVLTLALGYGSFIVLFLSVRARMNAMRYPHAMPWDTGQRMWYVYVLQGKNTACVYMIQRDTSCQIIPAS